MTNHKRIPVRYKGKAYMPMLCSRAGKLIKQGRAKLKYFNKLKVHYIELLYEPSGDNTQIISVGIDPGSWFDGFSVVSRKCHHLNVELLQRPKRGKTAIKSLKKRQAMNRRVRRSRLRHRKARFDNRTSIKLNPTIRANVDFRKWLVSRLLELFPISQAVVEDVRFNHFSDNNGSSFSLVEQGKTELYRWLRERTDLYTQSGFETSEKRKDYFGEDPKSSDKSERSFEAHCIDSFVIAAPIDLDVDYDTGELLGETIVFDSDLINREVIFIEKIFRVRRNLHQWKAKYRDKKFYKKYLKGGEVVHYTPLSRRKNICRVKESDCKSNHGPWTYIDNGYAERKRCFRKNYGGTVDSSTRKPKALGKHSYNNQKLS